MCIQSVHKYILKFCSRTLMVFCVHVITQHYRYWHLLLLLLSLLLLLQLLLLVLLIFFLPAATTTYHHHLLLLVIIIITNITATIIIIITIISILIHKKNIYSQQKLCQYSYAQVDDNIIIRRYISISYNSCLFFLYAYTYICAYTNIFVHTF